MKTLTGRIGQSLLLLSFCISAQNVFGTQIDSGSIELPRLPFSGGVFSLSGNDFTASGSFTESGLGPLLCRPSCSVLDLEATHGGFVSPSDFSAGAATVGGTTFPVLSWAAFPPGGLSLFNITGPDIAVNGPGIYVGTFSFTGSLCGGTSLVVNGQHPCVVDLPQLTGSGIVTDVIEAFPNGQLHEVDLTFTFVAPEPSSFVLVGTAGLIFFLARKRLIRAL